MGELMHTPGPWEWTGETGWGQWELKPDVIAGTREGLVSISDADAKLIAAAPELLGVLMELKECASYWSEYDVPLGIVDRINDAIAKATNG